MIDSHKQIFTTSNAKLPRQLKTVGSKVEVFDLVRYVESI